MNHSRFPGSGGKAYQPSGRSISLATGLPSLPYGATRRSPRRFPAVSEPTGSAALGTPFSPQFQIAQGTEIAL